MDDLQINLLQPDINSSLQPPTKNYKGCFIISILIALVIFGTVSCVIKHYSLAKLPTDPANYDPVTLKPKSYSFLNSVANLIFQPDNVLVGQRDDRINILLLGMGGPGHDGPFLTDTNIVVSIKPSTKEIAMLSIPRDLAVNLPGYGVAKINHANAYGESLNAGQGGEYARQIFAKTLGIDIPYYIRIDFKAFENIIDAVGGVNINVKNSFSDYMFPGPDNSYQTIEFVAGPQLMNGQRALEYARSRHGNNSEGSDFARSRRQQQVLSALKEKLLSFGTYTNPLTIQKILGSLTSHISTNLDFGQIMYLASLGREIRNDPRTLVLDNGPNNFLYSSTSPESGYLLYPKNGNFNDIKTAFSDIFTTDPSKLPSTAQTIETPTQKNASSTPLFSSAKIEIQNGTWVIGLASRMQKRLTENGFTISNVGNSAKRPIPITTVYTINPNVSKEITSALSAELNALIENTLPDWLKAGYNTSTVATTKTSGPLYQKDTDILLILGEDTNEQ